MSGRLILLVAAALGLGGVVAWDIGQRGATPPAASASRPSAELIAPALERPLFAPSRRPVADAPITAAPAPSAQTWRLVGVADSDGVSIAVIDADGARARLKRGQSLNGWRLESVGRRSAVLVRDGERKELEF
jgi:hypothetical protein